MPRVPYVYLWMPNGWSWLVLPINVYVLIHLGIGYFKARGVKKDSIPDILFRILIISGVESFLKPLANRHRVFWVCSEFRACTQRFLASINRCSNGSLFSDLMKFTAVNESLS